MPTLKDELKSLVNRHSRENVSGTPDYLLAQFLIQSLEAFEEATRGRTTHRHGGTINEFGTSTDEKK